MSTAEALVGERLPDSELVRAFGRVGPARRADSFAQAIQAGTPASQALRQSGAPAAVADVIEQAQPTDVLGALHGLAAVLDLDKARQEAVRGAAFYPFLLAIVSVGLGVVSMTFLPAALSWIGPNPHGPQPVLSLMPVQVCIAVSATLLLFLAAVLFSKTPMFPFARPRETHDRALLLAVTTTLVQHGASLPGALRGALCLARSPSLRADGTELVGALERGEIDGEGRLLLGSFGAGMFAGAVKKGAGLASLAALADLHESVAANEMPGLLIRAELLSMLLGGIGVASAGIAFISTYTGFLGR